MIFYAGLAAFFFYDYLKAFIERVTNRKKAEKK